MQIGVLRVNSAGTKVRLQKDKEKNVKWEVPSITEKRPGKTKVPIYRVVQIQCRYKQNSKAQTNYQGMELSLPEKIREFQGGGSAKDGRINLQWASLKVLQ